MGRVAKLADRVAMKGKEASYDALADLIDWWFKRLIRAQAVGEGPAPVNEADAAALAAFRALGPLERSLAIRDRAIDLLGQAHPPANLDRRQLVSALFMETQRLAMAR